MAGLANCIKGAADNEDVHFADTVRGSDWGADQEVVRLFVHTGLRQGVSEQVYGWLPSRKSAHRVNCGAIEDVRSP